MSTQTIIQAKCKASLIHGVITLIGMLISASIIFLVWFPGELAQILNATKIYTLTLFITLCLGPLISLVIYNPFKRHAVLIRDYSLVGIVQLAAFAYGLYIAFIARPVFMVFVIGQVEIVRAFELDQIDIQEGATAEFQSLSILGPMQVCVNIPEGAQIRSDLLWSALQGKDIHLLPKYYRRCKTDELLNNTWPSAPLLATLNLDDRYRDTVKALPQQEFSWLPMNSEIGSWIEVYPTNNTSDNYYVPMPAFLPSNSTTDLL